MPLHAESSEALWQAAGGGVADEDEEEELLQQAEDERWSALPPGRIAHGTATSTLAADNADNKLAATTSSSIAAVNTSPAEQDDEDEFTYNPDAELHEAQADQHAAYEGQQFYEKIQFGEFGKYMANKRRKLGVQQGAARKNAQTEETSELLKGLRIHINGETEPPAHVLSHLVVLHGGVYVPYLDAKKTSATHIIASKLTPSKRVAFKEYKVVRAEWLTDSIRDQKIKDWRLYREDQTAVRENDIGIAPAGTQIAQPKLSFASASAIPKSAKQSASRKATPPTTPAKVQSPRRLPPPTSDPLTLLHVEANAALPVAAPTAPQPAYITEGWYSNKSNARSAELLKDETWRLNETAVNTTEFLEKYYQQSRLHWLSTWKAELKKMVGELSEKQGKTLDLGDGRKTRKLKGTEEDGRVIMHIDFDSFFVSASLLSRQHLKGLPVVVCHAANTGDAGSSSEIASASYEARAFGIKNGMSLGSARTRCPQVQTVPYDFELYREISSKFYTILFSHALELEAVSIDEAYISLPILNPARTGQQLLNEAEEIRSEILEATGLQTSIGVSHNKLLARLATNRAKPSSSFQIGNGVDPSGSSLRVFLNDIDIESLPQIGWKKANDVEEKLKELSIRLRNSQFAHKNTGFAGGKVDSTGFEDKDADIVDNVGKLLRFQKNSLKEVLGEKTGEMLYNYARGIDSRELEMESIRKSVSAEVNYGIRFKSPNEVETFCHGLGREVASRLGSLGYKGRQLTLKVMRRAEHAPIEPPKFLGHGVCDVFNASKAIDLTNDATSIGQVAWELMRSLACPPHELRGIGLQMQKLENSSASTAAGGKEGQSRLLFQVVPKDKPTSESPAKESAPALVPHTPIAIGNSSSSPLITIQKLPNQVQVGRSTRSRGSVNYIDLSSEPEDDEEDLRVLSQAPTCFASRAKAGQTLLNGQVVKKASVSAGKPQKAIVIPATSPAAAIIDPAPSLVEPASLTIKDLSFLGLDAGLFQCCSRSTQIALLEEVLLSRGENNEKVKGLLLTVKGSRGKKGKKKKSHLAPVFEEAALNAAKKKEMQLRAQEKAARLARGPVYYKLQTPNSGSGTPNFAGKQTVADIRTVLAAWMDGVGPNHAPALEEVEEFASFCVRTVSSSATVNGGKGQDVERIHLILQWWDHLIRQRETANTTSGSQELAVTGWREAYTDIIAKVNREVDRQWGAPLACL